MQLGDPKPAALCGARAFWGVWSNTYHTRRGFHFHLKALISFQWGVFGSLLDIIFRTRSSEAYDIMYIGRYTPWRRWYTREAGAESRLLCGSLYLDLCILLNYKRLPGITDGQVLLGQRSTWVNAAGLGSVVGINFQVHDLVCSTFQ